MTQIVMFGAGKIAEEVYLYLTHDSPFEVVAFTVDREHLVQAEKRGLPVVPFDEVQERYPPDRFDMFVATGYQDLNKLRASKYNEAKAKGYKLVSYISSRACNLGGVKVGDNCIVLENTVLQPTCKVGSNVFLWCGNHVGHHATLRDHCFIAGQVIIGGSSVIEPHCFLGVNATIGHEVVIGEESFIGAAALVTKNAAPRSVHIVADTPKFRLDSPMFMRLTKMK